MDESLVKRQKLDKESCSTSAGSNNTQLEAETTRVVESGVEEEINLDELESDPALRRNIYDYKLNQVDKIRLAYLQRGPCQPRNHNFPLTRFKTGQHRFNPKLFDEHASWLEYSIKEDAAYCLYCYLFKSRQDGGESFVDIGFRNWKKEKKFHEHVGGPSSSHKQCLKASDDLLKNPQQSEKARSDYRICLAGTLHIIKYMVSEGLVFPRRYKSNGLEYMGIFRRLLVKLAESNYSFVRAAVNAIDDNELASPDTIHDLIHVVSSLATKAIIHEIEDGLFTIVVHESRDTYIIAVSIRYVNKYGRVVERFLGIIHLLDIAGLSLKATIESFLTKHGLNMSNLRGQSYSGVDCLWARFQDLKLLILKENTSAFFVHSFNHQLQAVLVSASMENTQVCVAFFRLGVFSKMVAAAYNHIDLLQEKRFEGVIKGVYIVDGELGIDWMADLHVERWGPHYGTVSNVINLYPLVLNVLKVIEEFGHDGQLKEARDFIKWVQHFESVFTLHMMRSILEVTDDLSQVLGRKDLDIVAAMASVNLSKKRLEDLKESGWDPLLHSVSLFCDKHEIDFPKMEDIYAGHVRNTSGMTNLHYYREELFYDVIDVQIEELNNRFDEVNTKLLLWRTCLDPRNSFSAFDLPKILRFATFYPSDFSRVDILMLEDQLQKYINDVRSDGQFCNLKEIGELSQQMVASGKHIVYPLVYLVIKLALLLPVETAADDIIYSAMKFINTAVSIKMDAALMNDSLVSYIEQDAFRQIRTEDAMHYFQNMKPRIMLL